MTVSQGLCGSTCAIFASLMREKHNIPVRGARSLTDRGTG